MPSAPATSPAQLAPVTFTLPGQQRQYTSDTAYISFSAEINPNTTESLIAAVATFVNQQVPHIYLLFSTPGGGVMNGMNIYNFLRGLSCRLTIHNVGNVDSIGNAIFLAGQHRYACAHSTFMFHGVGVNVPPNTRLEEKSCRERLESIVSDQDRIGKILEERTSLTADQVKPLFLEAQTKDSTYAVGSGIVHEVRDVQIPTGGPVLSLVFQR
jgi:ATP-dependent protease ClpP protease subunit